MARRIPRQSRSRALVEAILEGALQVIGKLETLETVTTKTVAKRAGVSIGSLYQYFPHKDALFSSLIERELKRQVTLFGELIESEKGSSVESLMQAFLSEAHALYDRTPALANLFVEATRLGAIPAVGETRTQIANMLADALRERAEFLEPLAPRVEMLIHAVMGVYEARAMRPGTLNNLPSVEEEVARLCDSYLKAIA